MHVDPDKKTMIAPFWLVRRTEDETEANMVLSSQVVEISCKVDRRNAHTDVHWITFDVMKNTRALAAGDELVIFKEAEAEPRPTKSHRKK
jgi:hypothetical protein